MHRLRVWLNLLLAVVPLLFLGAGASKFVQTLLDYLNRHQQIARVLSVEGTRFLGSEIRVGDLTFTGDLFSYNSTNLIVFKDVFIAGGSSPNSLPIFRTERISLRYSLAQLLDPNNPHLPYLNEISVLGPQLLLSRDNKGRWNYESLLKPPKEKGRPIVGKIVVDRGTISYFDQSLPAPKGVAPSPFSTRVSAIHGIVNLRPDDSFAFDLQGKGSPELFADLHTVGSFAPKPMHVILSLHGGKVNLAQFSRRLVNQNQLKVTRGLADLDIGGTYAAPQIKPKEFDPAALKLHGKLTVTDGDATGEWLAAPLFGLNGDAVFTTDSVTTNLKGNYAGMDSVITGSLFGYSVLIKNNASKASTLNRAQPFLDLSGTVRQANARKIVTLSPMRKLIADIPQPYRKQVQELEANGDVQFHVSGALDRLEAKADGALTRVKYDTYVSKNARLQAYFGNRTLIADLKGDFAGGKADLRTRVEFDDRGAFQVEANGRNLRLDRLGAPISEPLKGLGQLDFAVQGVKGKTPSYTLQSSIKDLIVRGQTYKSLYAQADTKGPELIVREFQVEDTRGIAQITGTVGLKSRKLNLSLNADELNLAELVGLSLKKPSKSERLRLDALPEPIFELSRLKGVGYVRGKIIGTMKRPEFDGKLFAFDLSGGRQKFDRVTLSEVKLTEDALKIKGKASRYPGEIDIAGQIRRPLTANPELEIEVSASQQSLRHLLNLAGVDTVALPVTGTVNTSSIAIRGTVNAPYLPDPFTLNLINASVNGLPIDNAAMTLRYRNEGVYIENVSGEVADGLIVGSGWIPFDGGADFNAQAAGVSLETLIESFEQKSSNPDPQLTEITGELDFKLHVGGSLETPTANLTNFIASNLVINNYPIGQITGDASYADRKAEVGSLKLTGPKATDGSISLTHLQYDQDSKQIRTLKDEPIRIDDFPIERVRDLVYNLVDVGNEGLRKTLNSLTEITGPFSATVSLHGDIENPEANIFWKTAKIQAKQYEISTLTGSATISKERLVYPSLEMPDVKIHLDSPYASLDSPEDSRIERVVIEFDRKDREGMIGVTLKPGVIDKDVTADLRVSNINLKFLNDILSKNLSREISGKGDLDIIASGKTHAPELQFTSVLRNVAFAPSDPSLPKVSFDKVSLLPSTINEGKIHLGELSLLKKNSTTGKTDKATVTGDLFGFSYSSPNFPEESRLSLTGSVEIPFLSQLSNQILRNGVGNIVFRADALHLGSKKPSISGIVNIDAPQLRFASLATGIEGLKGRIMLNGDRLEVKNFEGRVQTFDKKKQPASRKKGSVILNSSETEIRLTGSIPLGFEDEVTKGDKDGILLTVPRLIFDETPFPGSKTGSVKGTANVNLKIVGSVKNPTIAGKVALTDASIFPATDEPTPGGAAFTLPKYSVAVQLGKNVNLNTAQLSSKLSTEQDIFLSNDLIYGSILLSQGVLKLPVAKFQLLPGSSLNLSYPAYQDNLQVLGLNVDIKARGNITASSLSGTRKRYQVTVAARGPLTGETIDPITGKSKLNLSFETSPNDLATNQQDLSERLFGAIIGVDSLSDASKNPGQTFANVLTGVFSGSVLPGIIDRTAASLGFEELSFGYDPIQKLTFSVSRKIVGPLYISYFRTLNAETERYDLKFSLRFKDRYQFSFDLDEQQSKKLLLEGVWKF